MTWQASASGDAGFINQTSGLGQVGSFGQTVERSQTGDPGQPSGAWRQDVELAAGMGLSAYRIDLDWSRIEPEPGKIDRRTLARYKAIAAKVRLNGMTPIVTLYSGRSPAWLAESDRQGRKGWLRPDAATRFAWYVDQVAVALGGSHPLWLTIREPLVLVLDRYVDGSGPPGFVGRWLEAWRALGHLLEAHAEAYRILHVHFPSARVSFESLALDAKLWPASEAYSQAHPADPGNGQVSSKQDPIIERQSTARHESIAGREPIAGRRSTGTRKSFDIRGWFEALATRLREPFEEWSCEPQLWLFSLRHPGLAGTLDYAALDYDFPTELGRLPDGPPWRWPVYPRGLYEAIRDYATFYGKPVLVAANGLATNGLAGRVDEWTRQAYLVAHVRELLRARSAGYPVLGYCYRSLVDAEAEPGSGPRFGLFSVEIGDRGPMRTPREVVAFYRDIALHGIVRQPLLALVDSARKAAPPLLPGALKASDDHEDDDGYVEGPASPQPYGTPPGPPSYPPPYGTPPGPAGYPQSYGTPSVVAHPVPYGTPSGPAGYPQPYGTPSGRPAYPPQPYGTPSGPAGYPQPYGTASVVAQPVPIRSHLNKRPKGFE